MIKSLEFTSRPRDGHNPNDPVLLLTPIPADVAIAGFSLLSAIVIALQVTVRTNSADSKPNSKDGQQLVATLARRLFLVDFARMLIPAVLLFGIYLSFPYLATRPSIDLVRAFGPILLSVIIAFFAADAGATSNPELAERQIQQAWHRRHKQKLEYGLRTAKTVPAEVSLGKRIFQIVVLALPPTIIPTIVHFACFGFTANTFWLAAASFLFSVGIYSLFVALFYYNAVNNRLNFVASLVVALLSLLVLSLTVVATALSASEGQPSWSSAAKLLLVYFALVACTLIAAMHSISSRALGSKIGLLRTLVVNRIIKNLRKLEGLPQQKPAKTRPSQHWLAVAAFVLSFIPPAGLLLGVIAHQKIISESRQFSYKKSDERWIRRTYILNIVFVVLFLIGIEIMFALSL